MYLKTLHLEKLKRVQLDNEIVNYNSIQLKIKK